MIILSIKTDQPEATIGLYENDVCLESVAWEAHRQLAETIHTKITDLLKRRGLDWIALGGVAVYKGPGSFTGLRIGVSVANALAYGLQIPIAGATGEDWPADALRQLQENATEAIVMPEYGAPVHITQPRK